jgi:hypothetical protein
MKCKSSVLVAVCSALVLLVALWGDAVAAPPTPTPFTAPAPMATQIQATCSIAGRCPRSHRSCSRSGAAPRTCEAKQAACESCAQGFIACRGRIGQTETCETCKAKFDACRGI